MKRLCILIAALFITSNSWSQVVMLPTFSNFSYSGTVVVPDSGSTHLGGVSRAAQSGQRSGFSPFGGRGTGRSMFRSTASAHVNIIDLAEMDRQILGSDPQEFVRKQAASTPQAKSETVASKPTKKDPVEQAKQLVRDARRCVEKGNFKVADYYYRRAVRELPPDLAALALQEYQRAMGRPPLAPVIAQAQPRTR